QSAVPEVIINKVNGAVLGVVSVDALIAGVQYEIVTPGTTDFTTLGAADSNVGTIFTSNGTVGTGTGIVRVSGAVPVDLGSVITLGISASDSNGGNVTQVEVFNGANSIGLASLVGVNTYRFDYQASSPGLLNLQVRATDDLGNIGLSDLATVSVITGAIPTVTIDSPGVGSIFNHGDVIPFEITASDDESISSVRVEVLSNGTSSESDQTSGQASGQEALKIDSVGNDQYR
ncbi:MAG: Ig-like domain-containing protein, partial [Verrucomicrobiota bacterium]|nr:Ig-like domain-containing protein [Verrucomicrobiota bacterium]